MNTYYITFGQQYRSEAHPLDNMVDPDGFVTVHADSLHEARLRAFAKFNLYYSGLYDADTFDASLFPMGELFAIN